MAPGIGRCRPDGTDPHKAQRTCASSSAIRPHGQKSGLAGVLRPCQTGKERKWSETFADRYSQATLFWNSMAAWEKEHIITAYRFELGEVEQPHIH
ncbi:catalase-related domain-containing protein [Catellatospora sp. TT07R-123]|uniref:catalase-related domain-containing protein n=1 Tax=Catellatospora sp. TT07R-123 TaxID=2733863 RepID=UPI001FD1CDEB|nr:catalase-related domain-containing protein [Catellatospora sp. TT07R-123]